MRIDFWTLFLFMKSLKITTLLIHPFLWSVIHLVCIEINLKYFSYQKMEKWHKLMSFIMCHIDSIEPDFHFNKFIYVSWGHSIIIDMVAHSTTQAIWLHISHSNSSIFTYSRNTPSTTYTISRTSTNFDCTVKIANWHAGASYVDVERKKEELYYVQCDDTKNRKYFHGIQYYNLNWLQWKPRTIAHCCIELLNLIFYGFMTDIRTLMN